MGESRRGYPLRSPPNPITLTLLLQTTMIWACVITTFQVPSTVCLTDSLIPIFTTCLFKIKTLWLGWTWASLHCRLPNLMIHHQVSNVTSHSSRIFCRQLHPPLKMWSRAYPADRCIT